MSLGEKELMTAEEAALERDEKKRPTHDGKLGKSEAFLASDKRAGCGESSPQPPESICLIILIIHGRP